MSGTEDAQPASYHAISHEPTIYFRPVAMEDLSHVHKLEAASYPPDEAASHANLEYRIMHASEVFLVAVQASSSSAGEDEVVGFVNGTCSTSPQLTHASMSRHEPQGTMLCVHSVCVEASRRRRGIASRMLKAYLSFIRATSPQLTSVHLLSKEYLVPLYERAGFKLLGPSDVVHRKERWYELALELGEEEEEEEVGEQQE